MSKVTSYSEKSSAYFSRARHDIVALMPEKDSRVLEIGCGNGATGALALRCGKAGEYIGIEIEAEMARAASGNITKVIVGDVEKLNISELGQFDILVMSEVLEHLFDPWSSLRNLSKHLHKNGTLYCSSPNISSKLVISNLLRGNFDYQEEGVFDITHLRWFTPKSYRKMIEEAGFKIVSIGPISPPRLHWRVIHALTGGRFWHISANQIFVVAQRI